MNGNDREKYIRDDSEFRGWMLANIEHLQSEVDLLRGDMVELKTWKVRVTTLSSAVGAIIGFIVSKVL